MPDQRTNWTAHRRRASEAAREAGRLIREHYERATFNIASKGRDNPVTTADLEANMALRRVLLSGPEKVGWLSEETVDSPERLTQETLWIVDPLDGTKEFIDRIPEFAVSVALVHRGEVQVGVVYNPLRDEMFSAVRGSGPTLNDSPIRVSDQAVLGESTVLASRSESKRGEWDRFRTAFMIQPMGSVAYKLASVAAGRADMTFTLTPKNEWDICAGSFLVSEAGGQVSNLDGSPPLWNQPRTVRPGLLATNRRLHAQLLSLVTAPGPND